MTRQDLVLLLVGLGAVALLCWTVFGCAPVQTGTGSMVDLKVENYRVYDVRPCDGSMICWPWQKPHRFMVIRNFDGSLAIIPEQANSDGLMGKMVDELQTTIQSVPAAGL